jgi:hypothetical protein
MRTHYKYLMKPNMPPGREYVMFDGKQFTIKGAPIEPAELVHTAYVQNETIPELVRTAISYSNPEKSEVHTIAKENPNVIDMEIAFSKLPEPEDPALSDDVNDGNAKTARSTAPRMDLAALHEEEPGKARLIFYEVKRFNDARIWGKQPHVLGQLRIYDAFLSSNEPILLKAYKNVCKGLLALGARKRPLHDLIRDVAYSNRDLVIDKTCRLIVVGFDQDQQKGRLKQLKDELALGNRMITRGSARGLKLS